MGQDSPSGVPGDDPRDGVVDTSSRAVVQEDRSFFGVQRMLPAAYGGLGTPVNTYHSGRGVFEIMVGSNNGSHYSIWTDVRGVDALIDSLNALKARASNAWELAKQPPAKKLEPLDPSDVPF